VVAHEPVERAAEVELEQSGERRGRHPQVLERERLVAAEPDALDPVDGGAGVELEPLRDVRGRAVPPDVDDPRARLQPLALDVLGESGDAREVVQHARVAAHKRAAADAALDEAARGQRGERLAHRHAAHRQRLGQLALRRQPDARRQPDRLDPVGEPLLDLQPGRLRGPLGDFPPTSEDVYGALSPVAGSDRATLWKRRCTVNREPTEGHGPPQDRHRRSPVRGTVPL
jgi:hypothetical protein